MPRLPPEGSLTAGLPTHCYVGNTSSGPIHSDDNDKGKNPAPTPEDSRSVRQYRNLAPPGLEPVGHLNSVKANQGKSNQIKGNQRKKISTSGPFLRAFHLRQSWQDLGKKAGPFQKEVKV